LTLVSDLVEDERELLDRGDNDLFSGLEEFSQIAGVFSMTDCG
jgi:hypothetical protein